MFKIVKSLMLVFLGTALPAQTVRIQDPIQASGFGAGWSVDPAKGALRMNIPVIGVPGDLPIPVVFRYNGAYASEAHTVSTWTQLTNDLGNPYSTYAPGVDILDRPIFATLHFGFVYLSSPQHVANTGQPAKPDIYNSTNFYVLEDGTQYSSSDFTPFATSVGGAFNLAHSFRLADVPASSVSVNSQGTLALYTTSSDGLGDWSKPAGILAPGTTTFTVLMDRDRARIFAGSLPILWIDRFGHSISFAYQTFTTGMPSGISAVQAVTVRNDQNKGLQFQYALPTAGAAAPSQILARLDYIGIQAPSLQVTGYSGLAGISSLAPIMDPVAGGPVLRPLEVRQGNPAGLPAPAWMASALPAPDASTFTEAWPADLTWTFTYQDATNSQIRSITDAAGVTTTFTWQANPCVNPLLDTNTTFRSVSQAVSEDPSTGTSFTQTWTWALPVFGNQTSWTTTLAQAWSGPGIAPAPARKIRYTLYPPTDPNFGNAVPYGMAVLDSQGNALSSVQNTYQMVGVDASLSALSGQTSTTLDGPTVTSSATLDPLSGLPLTSTTSAGDQSDRTTYTYESHPDLLEPKRLIQVDYSRTAGSVTTNAPSQVIQYDPATWFPSQTYLSSPADGRIGTVTTYDPASGRKIGGANFATAPMATTGVATQKFTLDPISGLPTSLTVTFDAPQGSDAYTTFWHAYDTAGRPLETEDALGVVTSRTWDARGRLASLATVGQAPVQNTYSGELSLTTQQNGRSTTTTLDGFGRVLTRVRGSDGVTETYQYDANGNLVRTTETSPGGASRTSSSTFDALGRVLTTTPVTGPSLSYAYHSDSANQTVVATFTPAAGDSYSTSSTRDLWGEVIAVTDPLSTLTRSTYDAQGHATSVTVTTLGGLSQGRTFTYNGLGLLVSRLDPETSTQTFSDFDAHGNPTTITENTTRTRHLAYDGLGRLRRMTSGADAQTFDYSGLARTTSTTTTSSGQTTSITYGYTDGCGRINTETVTPPAGPGWTQSYAYDAAGRLVSMVYPDGGTVSYTFDDQNNYGRVTAVAWNGANLVTLGTNGANGPSGYDDWGNLQLLAFASGSQDQWYYSQAGLLLAGHQISAPGAAFPLRPYSYDANNHLSEAGEWSHLDHDVLGRLKGATLSTTSGVPLPPNCAFSMNLDYDSFGNNTYAQLSANPPPAMINFDARSAMGADSNEIPANLGSATTGWTYPGAPNVGEPETVGTGIGASAAQLALTWDGFGRLASAGGTAYAYYPSGLRASRTDAANPQGNQVYAYTSGGKLLSISVCPSSGQSAPATRTASLKKAASLKPMVLGKQTCDASIDAPESGITVQTGQSVAFSGSSLIGGSASWTFGDGGTATGFNVTHAFATAGTYTVRIVVTGPQGTLPGNDVITLTVVPALAIGTFSASATTLPSGASTTLTWSTSGATTVTLNGSAVAASGSRTVTPTATTQYTLSATNGVNSVTSVQTITVVPFPVITAFSASAGTLLAGTPETLSWNVSGATSLSISPSIGTVSGSSYTWTTSVPGTSAVTTTYTLTATRTVNGVNATRTAQATVTVEPDPTVPSIAFSASPATLGGGQTTTLSWNITSTVGTVSAVLSGGRFGSGTSIAASGSATDAPSRNTTYVITATSTELGAQAQGTASVDVTVLYAAVPVVSLAASPAAVQPGQSTTLTWNVTHPDGGTLTGVLSGPGISQQVPMPSGSLAVSPSGTGIFTLTVTNTLLGNQASATAATPVQVISQPVITSFRASSPSVVTGASVLLNWNVTGATTVCINGSPQSGSSLTVFPVAGANTYTLTATNAVGSATPQTLTINVTNWMGDVVYLGNLAIAEITPSGIHELHCDHLGTPIVITSGTRDANGNIGRVEGQQYFGPYGEQLLSSSGYTPMTGFTGHLQTEPNGLIYMRGRFYSPTWHRFLNSDQGADPGQLNQFAYCGGSPMMRKDPSGFSDEQQNTYKARYKNDPFGYQPSLGFWAGGGSFGFIYNGFALGAGITLQQIRSFGDWGFGFIYSTISNGFSLSPKDPDAIYFTSKGDLYSAVWVKGGDWQDSTSEPNTIEQRGPRQEDGYGWQVTPVQESQTGQSTQSWQPGLALMADEAGFIPGTKGLVGITGSVANDPSTKNLVINAATLIPVVGPAVAVVNTMYDAGVFIQQSLLAPMFNAAPPQMIDDGNGHLIPNPALMSEYEALN